METIDTLLEADTTQKIDEQTLTAEMLEDPRMFAGFYRKYLTRVYHYLLARVGDTAEAEDLTGRVFLDALESLPNYRAGTPLTAWLFTIASRRAADHHRRKARQAQRGLRTIGLEDEENQPASSPDPLDQVIRNERLARLRDLFRNLPDSDQELLRLRFAGGLTFEEIARVTHRKESAVKMALYRLLERLEKQMGENDE